MRDRGVLGKRCKGFEQEGLKEWFAGAFVSQEELLLSIAEWDINTPQPLRAAAKSINRFPPGMFKSAALVFKTLNPRPTLAPSSTRKINAPLKVEHFLLYLRPR
jgi:hypothetical protein